MKSKYYWIIFIIIAVLIGLAFLMAGGFFDEESVNIKSNSSEEKNITLQKNDTDKNNIEQLKKIDLTDSDVDFEADSEDFADEISSDDVKDFDKNLDLSSVDSEVY